MNTKSYFSLPVLTVYAFMLLAFVIPIHKKVVIPVSVLICLLLCLQFKLHVFKKSLKTQKFLFLPLIFYCFVALSLLWTENIKEGLFDIEIKFSLFAFPIFFMLLPFTLSETEKNKILKSFLFGVFVAIIYCLVKSYFLYLENQNIYYSFFYSRLSSLHHPTYFALYINFAIIILLVWKKNKKISPYTAYICVLFLLAFNWLLMSRVGLLTTMLIIIFFLYDLFFSRKYKEGLTVLIITLIFTLVLIKFSKYPVHRINTIIKFISEKTDNREGEWTKITNPRLITWKASIYAIRHKPVFGTGAGDVHEALSIYYKKNNYNNFLERKLNSHNQFLQTGVTTGLTGFLILCSLFFFGLNCNYRNKNYIGFLFFAISFITMLTESVLEIQSGVVFCSFFICLFLLKSNQADVRACLRLTDMPTSLQSGDLYT